MSSLEIPKEIKKSVDILFLEQLYEEMHCILGLSLDMFEMGEILQKESTNGFTIAFLNACKKLKKNNLISYVRKLDWADSELFDDYLVDRMKEEKMILPDDEEKEIERQLGINALNVYDCCQCGKFYKKEDVIQLKDEETNELVSACECKNCFENSETVVPLIIDRKEAILHHLKYKEDEIFFCKSCQRYYLKKWKKGEICHNCDILTHSKNKSSNSYFLKARTVATKWSSTII